MRRCRPKPWRMHQTLHLTQTIVREALKHYYLEPTPATQQQTTSTFMATQLPRSQKACLHCKKCSCYTYGQQRPAAHHDGRVGTSGELTVTGRTSTLSHSHLARHGALLSHGHTVTQDTSQSARHTCSPESLSRTHHLVGTVSTSNVPNEHEYVCGNRT